MLGSLFTNKEARALTKCILFDAEDLRNEFKGNINRGDTTFDAILRTLSHFYNQYIFAEKNAVIALNKELKKLVAPKVPAMLSTDAENDEIPQKLLSLITDIMRYKGQEESVDYLSYVLPVDDVEDEEGDIPSLNVLFRAAAARENNEVISKPNNSEATQFDKKKQELMEPPVAVLAPSPIIHFRKLPKSSEQKASPGKENKSPQLFSFSASDAGKDQVDRNKSARKAKSKGKRLLKAI